MCLSDLRARKSHELCSNYVNLPRRFWEINLTNDRGSYFSIIDHSEQAMSKSHELINDLLKTRTSLAMLINGSRADEKSDINHLSAKSRRLSRPDLDISFREESKTT